MAFSRLMLTTSGKVLFAKAQQGKPLKFTRVAIGDGNLGSGSLVNRTTLISEKRSLLIDVVQLTDDATTATVVAQLSNADLANGFYFRELGIYAKDPDTHTETLYVYDNAGADGEYIPADSSGVIVSEYLKLMLQVSGAPNITFNPSGNPLYLTRDEVGVPGGVAGLDAEGKVPSGQLPEMSAAAMGIGIGDCNTSASVGDKEGSIPGLIVKTGVLVSITFKQPNIASSLTLNINGTGAKPVWFPNTSASTAKWFAWTTLTFTLGASGTWIHLSSGSRFEQVSLTVAGWATDATYGGKSQTITTVPTVPEDAVHIGLEQSNDAAAAALQREGFACVTRCIVGANSLRFICADGAPTVALTCNVELRR